MPSARSIKNKLNKKLINKLGTKATLSRPSVIAKDFYGEPVGDPFPFTFFKLPVLIVLDIDKREEYESNMGGLTDPKKEKIFFYISADIDIRIGDEINFPPGTPNKWLVEKMSTNYLKGINVLTEVTANRDPRY